MASSSGNSSSSSMCSTSSSTNSESPIDSNRTSSPSLCAQEPYHCRLPRLVPHAVEVESCIRRENATQVCKSTNVNGLPVSSHKRWGSSSGNPVKSWRKMARKDAPSCAMVSNRIATIHMTAYCFDVIYSILCNHQAPTIPSCIPNDKYPIFVTWKKGYERRLRGCIGTFSNLVLHKSLHEYAIISAFKDSRFDPISIHEVEQLHCAVSILINFEKARDYRDWIVGVHGIRIEFQDSHHYRDAVYLPEVASEQGWTHAETLDNLMRKGGFKGHISEEMRMKVTVVRFQSDKVHMSYQEYIAYKLSCGERIPSDTVNGKRSLFHSYRR
ncbi:hypothetical protein AB6A40_003641 [Gnathostoma spinigerum]|uniref:AMMECR1 domain-containing protein n=1 Tax=Gnathostoma spinigerum TaxID=75299 RepID=A0ABD6ECE5_9BILA